jgi:hypothetical protein
MERHGDTVEGGCRLQTNLSALALDDGTTSWPSLEKNEKEHSLATVSCPHAALRRPLRPRHP